MGIHKNFYSRDETPMQDIPWGAKLWPMVDSDIAGSSAMLNAGIMSFDQYGGHGKHQHEPERAQKTEILYCLSGEGVHIFWDKDKKPTRHQVNAGDLICCVNNWAHATTNDKKEPFVCLIFNGG